MVKIVKLNESHVRVTGDRDEMMNIKNYFEFFAPNYQWSPKYKAGIWSGKISLLDYRTGKLPIGLFPKLKEFCKATHIQTNIDFNKTSVKMSDDNIIRYAEQKLKLNFKPRDYQVDGVRTSFARQKAIILSPTASGKSLIQYMVSQLFLDTYKEEMYKKVLMIVPTVSLVEQMKGDFVEYAENFDPEMDRKITTVYSGQERNWDRPIIVSTWQSLQTIKDPDFFKMFGCVLVDEVHSAESAIVIQDIIGKCTNARMKIGVSGTINDETINQIQLEGLFGKIHQFTTTKDLMQKGTLSKLKIKVLLLKYKDEVKRLNYKLPYHDEMSLLQERRERLKLITKTTAKINKNVLILFKNLAYGEAIYEELLKMNLGRKVHYVAGSTKSEIREQVRKITSDDTNGIIVASLGVFSTGINIPSLDYCIFAQPFKSKIKVLQSIGRILRRTGKKDKAFLIDLADDLTWRRRRNYSLKHALQRIDIYEKEGFDYNITEIAI
jgi:superfamily II DNA or RNA helicase